jgi:hypothetical protein
MDLDIEELSDGFKKLCTFRSAHLFFKHRASPLNDFLISTEKNVVTGGRLGWYFEEHDLRQAAELFLRLADQLEEERTKGR